MIIGPGEEPNNGFKRDNHSLDSYNSESYALYFAGFQQLKYHKLRHKGLRERHFEALRNSPRQKTLVAEEEMSDPNLEVVNVIRERTDLHDRAQEQDREERERG